MTRRANQKVDPLISRPHVASLTTLAGTQRYTASHLRHQAGLDQDAIWRTDVTAWIATSVSCDQYTDAVVGIKAHQMALAGVADTRMSSVLQSVADVARQRHASMVKS
jgi:hypothetical protein